MSETTLKTTFQLRRGTAVEWTSANPTLAKGEPGFETDTYKLKIGDGTTKWNNLNYFGGTFTVSADGKSINLEDSIFSIYGFNNATIGQVPTKGADGKIQWVAQSGGNYTAGENIQISAQNVISATDTIYDDTDVKADITSLQNNKLNVLPKVDDPTDPGFGWEYHIPYRFDVTLDAEKANVDLHTLTLDNKVTKMTFNKQIPSASTTTAGLMSATDKVALNGKQDKLTAGTNITIDENNVISATGGGTTYTAGTNIDITDNKISVAIDDIELTGTSGTFTDEQIQKLSNSSLTCLILNNKRFKLQYTSVGRSGIVAMYTSTIDNVSEIIEVDVTNKVWGYGETSLQKSLTAGDNISITNNVISAIDTKLATSITLGKQITASQTVGGIAVGKVYAATDTLAQVIEDLLGGSGPTPTDTKLYYSIGSTAPTSVTGMTSVTTNAETLKTNGYVWKNITLNEEYPFLAIDKTLGIECYEILQNGFALGFNTVDLGDQILYYPDTKGKDTGLRLVYHFE